MGLFEFFSDEKNREGTWLEGKEVDQGKNRN